MKNFPNVFLMLAFIFMLSCQQNESNTLKEIALNDVVEKSTTKKVELSEAFKDYWYNGEAEITSYKLEQARYGEIREGKAVMVFVTEDFLPEVQVKADNYKTSNIPVLKLNTTKNFNTGIYPYSIMQSTFYPVSNNQHAIKISASIQEWCGQVYTQLNNRESFEITSHSYFQNEADQRFKLDKTWTENELFTKLRINPNSLPTGDIKIIPSLEYTRLRHEEIKAYDAYAALKDGVYILSYPSLNRSLQINFSNVFPYEIMGWEEMWTSGFGASAKTLTTKATRLKTIKSAYWRKNKNADNDLRQTLKLK
ncbi:septum formation inhibitor Maf [Winogradskyella alexanderae]|uniref:Septum formation inhibitor Maf n=1 Tax=Winogradskyella alexanderae TaxID=2877123 RepID=A0ABS7XPC6_9FLAO|nr:septum formation inhibitor Maf [Winogradskyella alexanderae]MCA0131862.1 septum formation inhibitor Maf [Winogradskyella alexanderae]